MISLGCALLRDPQDVVVVDHVRLARDAVVDDVVEAAREVDLEPVREVAAVRELEREDRVARLERREVDGHVRDRARVRLHVRVVGAEELLRPVDRERLDLVDDLAAAVVALARVALRVLVRRDAADRLEHARPREVLGGDELDLVSLPLELAAEQVGDLGIDLREARGAQLLERQVRDGHPRLRILALLRRWLGDRRANPRQRLLGRHRALAQDARLVAGDVDDRGRHARAGRRRRERAVAERHVLRAGSGRARRAGSRSSPRRPAPARARASAASGPSGTRRPIASGLLPASQGSRRAGFGATIVNGPGSTARRSASVRPRSSGTSASSASTSRAEQRRRLLGRPALRPRRAARPPPRTAPRRARRPCRSAARPARPSRSAATTSSTDEPSRRPSTTRGRPARSSVTTTSS